MMITVNKMGHESTGYSITGHYDGKTFGVLFNQEKYDKMLELADKANKADSMEELKGIFLEFEGYTKESYKDLVESKTPYLMVNKSTNKFFLKWQDKVSSIPVPQALVDRVITSIDKGIDFMPLLKCWVRFLRNPNFTNMKAGLFAAYINKPYVNHARIAQLVGKEGLSREVAEMIATTTQVTITQEGLLGTYKVSTELDYKYEIDPLTQEPVTKKRYAPTVDEDTGLVTYALPQYVEDRKFLPVVMGMGGDPFMCGDKKGHIIQVGKWHSLESWDQVDCKDGTSGKKGLHVGGLDYIKGYQTENTITHNVFVDPMDIGAFTDDGTGAIRVRRYFVHSSFAAVNRSIYHSSTVATYTDGEWDKMIGDAVAATQEAGKALDNTLAEKQALIM